MTRLLLLLLLALPSWSATNRTVTVKPSGGDYTSLAAAVAGEVGDLVSLDRQLTIECYAMADTTAVVLDDTAWTTDATRYVLITAPAGERHAGIYTTSKYRLTVANAHALTITSRMNVIVEHLQIHVTSGSYSPLQLSGTASAASNQTYRNNIIRGHANVSSRGLLHSTGTSSSSRNVYIYNNLIYDVYRVTNAGRGIYIEVVGNYYIWNNTIALAGQGLLRNNGVVIAVNNLMSVTAVTASGTFAAGTNYNATTLSTMGYTVTGGGNANDRTSQTFTFVNSGSGDYHLGEADAGAKDVGATNPSSGVYTTDVDGDARSGSWDIGYDEIPSALTRKRFVVVGE